MTPIYDMPTELLVIVAKGLPHHDRTSLARVSKQFQVVVEPLIWRDIELHAAHKCPSKHRHSVTRLKPPQFRTLRGDEMQASIATGLFLSTCATLRHENHERWTSLAATVRSLCLTVEKVSDHDGIPSPYYESVGTYEPDLGSVPKYEPDVWNTLLLFPNIETLDVIATDRTVTVDWEQERVPVVYPGKPLMKLRYLRLLGYVAPQFVQKIYAPNIERLDCGLLEYPYDRSDDPDGSAYTDFFIRRLDNSTTRPRAPSPRPMLWVNNSSFSFSRLTHLTLCKPSEAFNRYRRQDRYESLCRAVFDEVRDRQALFEWANLLQKVRHSLVSLTLDQRHTIDDVLLPMVGEFEAPRALRSLPGDLRFLGIVMPVLLEEGMWPALKRLEFRAIVIDQKGGSTLVEQLHSNLPDAEMIFSGGNFMFRDTVNKVSIRQGGAEDGLLPQRYSDTMRRWDISYG